MQDFVIRTASIEDIDRMLEWARIEGWNPGLQDAVPFHVTDPSGFLMGYLNGESIASLSVVRYPKQFAFLGFYLVTPHYRGRGYGWRLWQAGMQYLAGYNIGLDGVVDQQNNYQRSGFKLAHRNIRFSGSLSTLPTVRNMEIFSAKKIPFHFLLDYDQLFFPAPRAAFLSAWLSMPNAHAYVAMKNEKMMGMGVIRQCGLGYKIGPLFAEDRDTAHALFFTLCTKAKKESVFIDIPEINAPAIQFIEALNFKPVFETARMYTKNPPELNWQKIMGVTTFELG